MGVVQSGEPDGWLIRFLSGCYGTEPVFHRFTAQPAGIVRRLDGNFLSADGRRQATSALRVQLVFHFTRTKGVFAMVTITFLDRGTEKRALGCLLGRFSGRVLRSGEYMVPEAALEALADQNIPFSVKGETTYEQQVAAIRGSASTPVQ
jgi:hypothetical protein